MDCYKLLYKKFSESLFAGFVMPSDTAKTIKKFTNQHRKEIESNIKEDPSAYELTPTFFLEGGVFEVKVPNNEEEKIKEKTEFDRKNKRLKNKLKDIEKFRESNRKRKFGKFEKKVKDEIKKELPELTRDVCKSNLGKISQFLKDIINNNFVIAVPVSNEIDAYQIFETLNARGQTLSKSDLVKNMCLRILDDDVATQHLQNEKWIKIFNETIGKTPDDDFLRESLRSRHFDKHNISGVIMPASKNNLFNIIENEIKTHENVKNFIQNLEDDAGFVKQINDPSNYADADSKDDIISVNDLNAINLRVPLLSAYRRWKFSPDFRKLLKFLVIYFFRNRTIDQVAPGDLDSLMIGIAEKISKNKDGIYEFELEKIIAELIESNVDEDGFSFGFERYEAKKESIAKYILLAIEDRLFPSEKHHDIRPVEGLSLEHILPQSPGEDWSLDDFISGYEGKETKFKNFTKKIGNMTLLTSPLNSAIKNTGFTNKKSVAYNGSKLEINKQTVVKFPQEDDKEVFDSIDQWTANMIKKRTEYFSELGKEIWNLDTF